MVTLHVLGALELRDARGKSVLAIVRQPKRAVQLVRLCILGEEGFIRRDVLTALFWPEADAEHARAALRTALHGIRRALGDVIVARGNEEVGLALADIWCDAVAFERAYREQNWRQALDLYRGEFLDGVHVHDASVELDRWIERERARYRGMAINAAWQLCTSEEERGHLTAALELARRAVAWSGTDEVAVRRLLRLHVAIGDRAGAIATFETFRRMLRQELEVEPSAETLALVGALRNGTTSGETAGPSVKEARAAVQDDLALVPRASRRRWPLAAIGAAAVAGVSVIVVLLGISRAPSEPVATSRWAATDYSNWASGVRTALRVGSVPVPLSKASAVYDALRDQVYVFGGFSGRELSDEFWLLDAAGRVASITWTRIEPRGRVPRPRQLHSAVYDSTTDQMIVFGGALGQTAPCANDVWMLQNPSRRGGDPEWLEMKANGAPPSPRADHSAVWVPQARRMIVFGGHDCIAHRTNDSWVLDVSADGRRVGWHRLSAFAPAPAARSNHSAVYDAGRDRVILFGGVQDPDLLDDVWELDFASSDSARWRPLRVVGEVRPKLHSHRAVWDPVGGAMIVFGGHDGREHLSAIWSLRDAGAGAVRWTLVNAFASGPVGRVGDALVYSNALDELIVIGGETADALLHDTWVLMNVTGRRLR